MRLCILVIKFNLQWVPFRRIYGRSYWLNLSLSIWKPCSEMKGLEKHGGFKDLQRELEAYFAIFCSRSHCLCFPKHRTTQYHIIMNQPMLVKFNFLEMTLTSIISSYHDISKACLYAFHILTKI